MNEAALKDKLVMIGRQALPAYVWLRHEDHGTIGIPDLTITGHGITSWWEVKYADPTFVSRGIQELVMKRLGEQGIARYLIFREDINRFVGVLTPTEFQDWRRLGLWQIGKTFDFTWVMRQVWRVHNP